MTSKSEERFKSGVHERDRRQDKQTDNATRKRVRISGIIACAATAIPTNNNN